MHSRLRTLLGLVVVACLALVGCGGQSTGGGGTPTTKLNGFYTGTATMTSGGEAVDERTVDLFLEISAGEGAAIVVDFDGETTFGLIKEAELRNGRVHIRMDDFASGNVSAMQFEGAASANRIVGSWVATLRGGGTAEGTFDIRASAVPERANFGGLWQGEARSDEDPEASVSFTAVLNQQGGQLVGSFVFATDEGDVTLTGVGRVMGRRVALYLFRTGQSMNVGALVSESGATFSGQFFAYEDGEPESRGTFTGARAGMG